MGDGPDIFNVAAQAEFVTGFAHSLPQRMNKFINHDEQDALSAIDTIDTLGDALRRANVSAEYITAVESIKQDHSFQAAVSLFEKSLDGKANLTEMAKNIPSPDPVSKFVAFRDDALVKREVITGDSIDGETDLIRYSNYIAGPGTSLGGAITSLPLNLVEMTLAFNNLPLYRYLKFTKKLKAVNRQFIKYVEDEEAIFKWLGFRPDKQRRRQPPYKISLLPTWINKNEKRIVERVDLRLSDRLLLKQGLLMSDLELEQRKRKRRLRAQNVLGKIGTGVQGATSTFGVAHGIVDMVAGDQMWDNAEKRLANGEIDKEAYNRALSNAHLRIAQGAFGVGDGINNLRRIAMDKLKDKVSTLSLGVKKGLRFASVIGGALSIAMGATAIAKHSLAAQDALKAGNVGRGVLYGFMAALDTVSVILDAVSMAFDCIPGIGTAISLAVDLLNTLVDFGNMFVGFFVDMVDTRSPEDRIKEVFDAHLQSDAFKTYIDRQAQVYKEKNYDLFVFMVDAKAMGLDEEGADVSSIDDTIITKLSEKAVADASDRTLRRAVVDQTSFDGKVITGGLDDDLLLAGIGGDTIYGLDGDDLMYGEGGNDTLYGGAGNDYLNGGTSADDLFGEEGDDFIVYEPGIDSSADGGSGTDTLLISADFFAKNNTTYPNALVLEEAARNRVYVDLRQEGNTRGGLALGALLNSFQALSNPMHQPAFSSASEEAIELVGLYSSAQETNVTESTLQGYYFWYLANRDNKFFLTDGSNIYSCTKSAAGEMEQFKKSNYKIDSISASLAVYNEAHKVLEYSGDSKLKAILAFAFRRKSDIVNVENVTVRCSSDAASSVDTSCQVIAGTNSKLIESSCGHNTYIYTGDEDTVLIVTLSDSPVRQVYKYIVGGSGNNTLIINGTANVASRVHRCILLDHDIDLAKANREQNEAIADFWQEGKQEVDRGIFLKNVQTIQFSNTVSDYSPFQIDSTNLSAGHHFIIDSNVHGLRFYGTAGDDKISIKMIAGEDNVIDGYEGKNMLSLESCEVHADVKIELNPSPGRGAGLLTTGNRSVELSNITSVRGHSRTKFLGGHLDQNNLLIASGGECTVTSRGGKNSLAAMRGRHVLKGGTGSDIYDVYGPLITEFVVVTVTKRDGVLAAKCMGQTSHNHNALGIPVLENDAPEVLLVSRQAKVVDAQGNPIYEKGAVAVSRNRRYLEFYELYVFDSMDPKATESVRIQYVTEGSTAVIEERTEGNALKLHGYSSKSQLKLEISSNGDLLFKDSANRLILTDKYWGDLYRSGVRNLNMLFYNFAARFSAIQFNGTDPDTYELLNEQVIAFLSDQLGHLRTTFSEFGGMLEITSPDSNIVDVKGGDNLIIGKSKNVSYRSGEGDDIFDLSKLGEGTSSDGSTTSVVTGEGDKVVIVGDNAGPVQISFTGSSPRKKRGTKILVFDDVHQDEVFTSEGPTFRTGTSTVSLDSTPDMLIFSDGPHMLVDDVDLYIAKRSASGPTPFVYRRVLSENLEQYGNFRFSYEENMSLRMDVLWDGLEISLLDGSTLLHKFRLAIVEMFNLEAVNIAHGCALEFQFGINLHAGVISGTRIRKLVMDCLRSGERHTVVRSRPYTITEHASEKSTHTVYLPDVNTLFYADQDGGEIYGGNARNVFKVTGSRQIVNTGPCHDSENDIVHIASDVADISVQLIARGERDVRGFKYVVIEGTLVDNITVSRPNGDAIPKMASVAPFSLKDGSRTLANFDAVPSHLLFGFAGEYEIVKDASSFVQTKATGSYKNRYILTDEGMVMLLATDVESGQFVIKVAPSGINTLVTFDDIYYTLIGWVRMDYVRESKITKGNLAVQIATYIAGGIRFRDRSVLGTEIVSFLEEVMEKPESTIESSIGVIPGEATESLDHFLARYNPDSAAVDIIQTCRDTFRITQVDPASS